MIAIWWMLRRGASIFNRGLALGVLPVLFALAAQLALPAIHQLDHRVQAPDYDLHNADTEHHQPDQRHHHDESNCPTCQVFASLRAYTPLTSPVAPLAIDAVEVGQSISHRIAIVHHVALTEAHPRAPPVCY